MSKISSERRFPNEIFTLIIKNLSDDHFTLRSLSLVCKDFAFLSQQHFFRHIDLIHGSHAGCTDIAPPNELRNQFVDSLYDPRASSFGRFVRRLDLPGYIPNATGNDGKSARRDHLPDALLILQSLPCLTELRLDKGRCELFHAIRKYLGGQLQTLCIRGVHLHRKIHFQDFQSMLTSLDVLQILAIENLQITPFSDQMALTLPSSLGQLHLTKTDKGAIEIVGLGMEISYPPKLHTVLVDLDIKFDILHMPLSNFGSQGLWRWLKPDTMIVIDVGKGMSVVRKSFSVQQAPALHSFIHRLGLPQVTLCCFQSPSVVELFAYLIRKLPDPVRDLSIEIHARAADDPADMNITLEFWELLDRLLLRRYQLVSLDRVSFRYTSNSRISWDSPSDMIPDPSRSLLNRIRKLLPLSDEAGLIEVEDI